MTLTEAIKAKLQVPFRGIKPWHLRIPAERLVELEEIRRQYLAGELDTPKRTLARAISESLNEEGISTVGFQGVETWLNHG